MEQVLKELKNKLRITWEDEDEDLEKMIKEAKSYFVNLTNTTFDFEKEDWIRGLLIERCRYDYHNSLDEFENNFAPELKRLIALAALGRVGKKNEEDEESS